MAPVNQSGVSSSHLLTSPPRALCAQIISDTTAGVRAVRDDIRDMDGPNRTNYSGLALISAGATLGGCNPVGVT